MKQPDKWQETIDPFSLSFTNFHLKEILGYPHAGNDVFHVRGTDKKNWNYWCYASRNRNNVMQKGLSLLHIYM